MIKIPCSNFNGGLAKPPLNLGHGWVLFSPLKKQNKTKQNKKVSYGVPNLKYSMPVKRATDVSIMPFYPVYIWIMCEFWKA